MPEFLMRLKNKGQLDCSMMLNNTGQSRSTVMFLFFISQLYQAEENRYPASGEIAGFKVVTVLLTYWMKLCNDVELA